MMPNGIAAGVTDGISEGLTEGVAAWAAIVTIPTYRIGAPNKNPMFLEKRVYQGSSGVVYPYPVIDQVYDDKQDQEYVALFLENRYLKVMLLPQIGGRVQMALDKTNNYHFVYHNQVIKPALVGLTGPWISGGIEFNWPQHHRPTTFGPLDWRIEENEDGSRTIRCAEIEPMFRTRGMHGVTLYPDRAYMEIRVQLYNRTDAPQTFLWWANPAVAANDDYQSIFPPDVTAVMDHGKRDVSAFPIATGTYYKMNYAPGTDISRYRNIPVPTSYMAYHSDFDFIGCYDHGKQAGMMHVADHHLVPGKKQWTWGNGDFGQAWDRQLSDEDGPYIELMCGAFTDNQPDFSWLQPGEEKSFRQYFMPYKQIGAPQNGSREVLLHLQATDARARIGVYVTRPRQVRVTLTLAGDTLHERTLDLSPEEPYVATIALPPATDASQLTLAVWSGDALLLSYTPLATTASDLPAPATAAPKPETIASNEELFLHGLHLEQYRHATYAPEPYYEEALRRDPLDSRCNNALGLLHYRRGAFDRAEAHFRTAIQRLTMRNPNPYNGEPYYNLGLALRMQGRFDEAFDAFYKAVWNQAWQAAGYFELARLASRAGRYTEALGFTERVLAINGNHHQARHLQGALHRLRGDFKTAAQVTEASLARDGMHYGALWERAQLGMDKAAVHVRADANTALEVALDYAHAGLFADAAQLLEESDSPDPLRLYLLGWVHVQAGDATAAQRAFAAAAAAPPDYGFPNRLEDTLALAAALRNNPNDARAHYYLGNFLYAHRRYAKAITHWQTSCALDDTFATAQRNLGLAYYNKLHDAQAAQAHFETAFALDPGDARVLFELDQLYKKLNHPPAQRLARLQAHLPLVLQRDDLTVEYVTLLNLTSRHDAALQILTTRIFHPWEGGEGKVSAQYVCSLVELARRHLAQGEFRAAIALLERALLRPHNLNEGKLHGATENNVHYYLGSACAAAGESDKARQHLLAATAGADTPASVLYYYDQPPEMIFYQGLAQQALGDNAAAHAIFQRLAEYGATHLHDVVEIDYFAVSLPEFAVFEEPVDLRHRIHCHYMMGLGALGLGDHAAAQAAFTQVLALDASHLGATMHQQWTSSATEAS